MDVTKMLSDARQAITDVNAAEAAAAAARTARDHVVAALHASGMRIAVIARHLGMSQSHVRLIAKQTPPPTVPTETAANNM